MNTAATLLEQAPETAAPVVVGSRGSSGFSGLLLGSVAVATADCSKYPVVIVGGDVPAPDGPVVVGVHYRCVSDGSELDAIGRSLVAQRLSACAGRHADVG
ncbi:universal stress protein [Lentzea kentuckyensis]|uniref:universal stress protein n=1 Tax=Lentzea kentuckyensis TaxID=360086 RepID=UPI000A3AF2EF|nr:universal stress protein [Lentzea kentuckyensis]